MSERVLDALVVAAEMTGANLSGPTLKGMVIDLSEYPEDMVLRALTRCRRELKHRLTLADVIERLGGADGRPSADEAWAKALLGYDENATVVMNDEIAKAMEIARPIMDERDRVGARMAFKNAYERIVLEARERKTPVRWYPSLGLDKQGRENAIREAVERGQLPSSNLKLLPPPETGFSTAIAGLLTHKKEKQTPEERESIRKRLLDLRNTIGQK